MIKYTILQRQRSQETHMVSIIETSDNHTTIGFLYIIYTSYNTETYESFVNNWRTKGSGGEDQTGTIFTLDEPSGIIYEYLYDDFIETELNFFKNLTQEQQNYFTLNQEEYPDGADFCRTGILQYISRLHKKNLFELFLAWDEIIKTQKSYLVWYNKESDWIYVKGFDTEQDARNFVREENANENQ